MQIFSSLPSIGQIFSFNKASPYFAYGLHEFVNLSAKADGMKDSTMKKVAQVGAYLVDFLAAMVYLPTAFVLNNTVLPIKNYFHKEHQVSFLKNHKALVGGVAATGIAGTAAALYYFGAPQFLANYFKK